MTKAFETAVYAFAASAIYVALLTGTIPTSETFQSEVVPVIPWWSLVTFGCYTLFSLGYGVYVLEDKKDKYVELKAQIEEAKTFLKAKGSMYNDIVNIICMYVYYVNCQISVSMKEVVMVQ